ncbi:hypothetical protein BP6252_12008 [Coleophoma cylindrospora]|uniref:2EXR domain-containing protein n=1 Tax=Coleophoma cylindrospora TaxID=1849047 RepID=A0A3D8QFQ2_9HELO|nr:hypothetical protein BP6252_12008 [Coleophoma cylindrospora]
MEEFQHITNQLYSRLFAAGNGAGPASSFPRFAELPTEVRLRIWGFALESSRIVPVHLHRCDNNQQTPSVSSASAASTPGLDEDDQSGGEAQDEEEDLPDPSRHDTLRITTCTESLPCDCSLYLARAPYTVPLPPPLAACRESWGALMDPYAICFDKEYNLRGLPVFHSASETEPGQLGLQESSMRTGVRFHPTCDTLMFRFNIASQMGLEDLHHFAAIAAREAPDIRRVVLRIDIVLIPYQWWQSSRFQRWKNWGPDSSWVSPDLVQFGKLRELVLLIDGKVCQSMLPDAWRERTLLLWQEGLEGMRHKWPEEWAGNIPVLRIAT